MWILLLKDHKGPDPCPICLDPVKGEAYLDSCFHSFCYQLFNDSKWSPKSTLKLYLQPNILFARLKAFSVVHGFNGENFLQHYFSQGHEKNNFSSAHEFRLQ
ncbi:uncharacterized protein A4U43_UnF6800 [Asparagus officinalis]|uniref:Uncharacterized protein n=1 Tax=Asparagus officinalis TaxID=4686 RepID=A0A1R3L6E5_ASPOF|nr:uncharacterized protein A4U43_UnF6800 [Asparagus officinalis]